MPDRSDSISIEQEIQNAYLDYAMSVIIGRALPHVRDGLKPVHRRILFAMKELGLFYNRSYKKSATVVGEVLGKYHPHGDMAVYDTLVRMVQDFSLRYPLLQGQGNFGSIDGDSAAAYRYTETRLQKIASELLADIDQDTVDFVDNFDGSQKEPVVLPAKFPNLLVNGSSGIAVGMATNIPPHNLSEVIDGCIALIDNPQLSDKQLLKIIPGPDFPTGGIIIGLSGVRNSCLKGKGRIVMQGKVDIEELKGGKSQIIIEEIPYQVNKAMLIKNIADLVKNKKIEGITDIRDESDRRGLRVVLELKRDTEPKIILNLLYKHTQLRNTFNSNMMAIVNNRPKMLSVRDMLNLFIQHRQEVVTRRTKYQLSQAEKKAHILEGLKKALDAIDLVISIIRKSKDTPTAKQNLMAKLELTEIQAQAILDMKLAKLTSLETKKIDEEYIELIKEIARLKSIIESPQLLFGVIKDELKEIKSNYGDKRRTRIQKSEVEELKLEDLIKEEEVVITLTNRGYIKRLSSSTYKEQGRGGKGVIGSKSYSEDYVSSLSIATTHDYLLCFTDRGQLHWLRVYNIPEAARDARGRSLSNLLNLTKETVKAVISVKEFSEDQYVFMATKKGIVKKCSLAEFSRPKKMSIRAISLSWDDELVEANLTNGKDDIVLVTSNGKTIRFDEEEVRQFGRNARGVIGIRLDEGDFVVSMMSFDKEHCQDISILTACQHGYGKLTKITEYPTQHRGGKGVIGINTSERNGQVVISIPTLDDDGLILISQDGKVIRLAVSNIRRTGRNTQGVRLMKLDNEDTLVGAAIISKNED